MQIVLPLTVRIFTGISSFSFIAIILSEDLPELVRRPAVSPHGHSLPVLVKQLHGLGAAVRGLRSFPVTPGAQVDDEPELLREIPMSSAKQMVPLNPLSGTAKETSSHRYS